MFADAVARVIRDGLVNVPCDEDFAVDAPGMLRQAVG